MKLTKCLVLAAALLSICFGLLLTKDSIGQSQVQRPVDFNRDIRPILSDNCFTCHGPDEKQRRAGLRLDTKEGAFSKPGVIVAGDSSRSRLIKRITAKEPEMRMPPPESGRVLSEKQKELLRRWIDEGARWEVHWAFMRPVRPDLPQVKDASWPRNAIDYFILSRLEREGLRPSPEADKATLLRRVTYDLTGLPPTLEEIDSFLADKSPDAYERRVDKLLSSPHYGERMAMWWLDLARYADTHGYHIDSHRDMWPWRDWVIKAFNSNMPFDQFTIEQLAGDLLPNATIEQRIATGFNRNHMINFEGGAIPEEYHVEYVVDRVETTATTWMGLTMGCARCHDHKYDPITQRDFYRFFAFFNNVSEEGLDGRTGNAKPFLRLPTDEQKAALGRLEAEIKLREEGLTDSKVKPLQERWEEAFKGKVADSPRSGLIAHYEFDGSLTDISGRYRHGRTIRGDPTFGPGRIGRSVAFDGDTQVSFGRVGSFQKDDKFSIAMWVKPVGNQPIFLLQKIEDVGSRRGYEMLFDDLVLIGIQKRAGYLRIRLTSKWPEDGLEVRTRSRLAFGEWHHVVLTYDGSGRASGLRVYVDGKPFDVEVLRDNLSGSILTDADLQVGNKVLGSAFRGQIDDFRLYDRVLRGDEVERLAVHYPIESILSGVYGKPSKEDSDRVRDYFLRYAAPEDLRRLYSELKVLKSQKEELEKGIVTVMVMDDGKPRETFVLARGDYRNKTEKVEAGVPAVLPPLAKGEPLNRLTLARWLVSPDHPLTARVVVNHFWQMIFGVGIVKTSEDFGIRGELPTHPELLDWLATEFIRTGWDVKGMLRLIVTSATYRQSSKVRRELLERDPENRLLARGPRFRLPAEMVRDGALAASGLLDGRIGGPSVFPYQPAGLWEETAFGDGFSAQSYKQSSGRDLYRRSLYTFWKRTVPPPSLVTFDAPDREKCVARRSITNTPLQALVLMNDPTYVEAARALAERVLKEGGKDTRGRIIYAFRLVTSREPSPQEVQVLRGLLKGQLQHYRRSKDAAVKLLRVGESKFDGRIEPVELAAWTTLTSAILNLDEAITKE